MKERYHIIVWEFIEGGPKVKLNTFVESRDKVQLLRVKHKNCEVHSWPVNEKDEPIR